MSAVTKYKSRSQNKGGGFFEKFGNWYKEQSTPVQIGVLIGGYIVAKRIYNNLTTPTPQPGHPGGQVGHYGSPNFYNYGTDQQQQQQAGIQPSYPAGNYTIFADQLYVAFEYSGTDEDAVKSVFKQMKNDADVTALIQAWGVRAISVFGWAQDYTLPEIIADELDRSEIEKYVNQPLAANGVNYRF